ncbi:MAG: hypothetical protein JNK05_40345 [Myxococcales bacterium]|nr:hypothetical protein [Myxococcales bacterium]
MRPSLAVLLCLGLIACAPVVTARTTCVPCGVTPVVDAALARVDAGSVAPTTDAAAEGGAVDAAVESPYSPSMRRQIAQWVTEASRLSERSLSVVCAGSASRVAWERGLFSIDCAVRDDASGYERAYRVFATATYEHLPAMTPWNDRMQFAKHCAADFALASMQSWLEAHHDLLGVHSTEPSVHPRLLAYRTANTSTVCVSSQPAHDAPYDACWSEPGMVDRIDERSFDFARDGDRVGAVRYDARMPDATVARVRVTFNEEGRARMSRGRAAARALATTAFPATGPLALLSARTQRLTGAGPLAIEWFSERQWLRCELIDRWRCQRAPRDR